MKRVCSVPWGRQFLTPRVWPRLPCPLQSRQIDQPHARVHPNGFRWQSTAAAPVPSAPESDPEPPVDPQTPPPQPPATPRSSRRTSSAKLAALHARLSLPDRLPLETLARTLIHPSADPSPHFNNESLSVIGADLLGYYTSEYLLCHYPRLPMAVLFAAQWAYVGPAALTAIAREWGVEEAAVPGPEVDPGLLQYQRVLHEDAPSFIPIKGTGRPTQKAHWRHTMTSRVVYDDQFGEMKHAYKEADQAGSRADHAVTSFDANKSFVRALVGAVYLHAGQAAAKQFFEQHFLSRQLNMASLFDFKQPTRDLSRLCAREGFEQPIARLISETGRLSIRPVFVVGVYSGADKLGEGVGASLDEARFKAAAAALKSWYLYRPLDVTVPSSVEGAWQEKPRWKPNVIDCGEVIV